LIQPFSQEFEREFNRIKSIVEMLDARMQEISRLQGSMYDRINQEAAQLQFALFCDVVGGEKGEVYDLEPAFDFYGVGDVGDFDKKMELVGAPQYVVDEFNDDGIVKAKNCVDHRYNDENGSTNLHGVLAPISSDSGLSGQVAILDIAPAAKLDGEATKGPGSVLAIFTKTPENGVHIGFYAKNDLDVTCGTDAPIAAFSRNGRRKKFFPIERTSG
tara:strand:+ start:2073 stop:2720 length:648 start_codon:yes stop_codon:yes gene_type:complete